MPAPEANYHLAEVRRLDQRIRAGGPNALPAFLELTQKLLSLTILAPGGTVKLAMLQSDRTKAALGGRTPQDPLPLNDGRYLRVSAKLYLDHTAQPNFLKVEETSYQYQLDREGDRWIFRYDYLRNPQHSYPAAHLQIRGELAEGDTLVGAPLRKIHFPSGRVSLEAVIRLLIEQFRVPCNQPAEVWRPVLAETERDFLRVAHQPLSGPER